MSVPSRLMALAGLLTGLLALPGDAWGQTPVPALILEPGETRSLSAQRWVFSSVVIPQGARLEVPDGGGQPLELIVSGDFRLQGEIVARGWVSNDASYSFVLPNGQPISVSQSNQNRGGDGGDGGSGGGGLGGRAAQGTTDYGGGGGGGGVRASYHGGVGTRNGADAIDYRGARAVEAHCSKGGGDGSRRDPYANGGIIYLEIRGRLDGTGGRIDVAGHRGGNGRDGTNRGMAGSNCTFGAGGPGGGAPGGQGGWVVAYVEGSITAYPYVEVMGGAGGNPGSSLTNSGALPATAGQRGLRGNAYWRPSSIVPENASLD